MSNHCHSLDQSQLAPLMSQRRGRRLKTVPSSEEVNIPGYLRWVWSIQAAKLRQEKATPWMQSCVVPVGSAWRWNTTMADSAVTTQRQLQSEQKQQQSISPFSSCRRMAKIRKVSVSGSLLFRFILSKLYWNCASECLSLRQLFEADLLSLSV